MTRIFDISQRLPDDIVAALRALDELLGGAGVRYLLVGALARDAVTSYAQGGEPKRATKDIDLAVCVDSMEHFRRATAQLEPIDGAEHKFRVAGVAVDLVPFFDNVERSSIEFSDAVLDTSGLVEAQAEADRVIVSGDLQVHTASLGGLCLLKVLAWRDRRTWTKKDAIDLRHLLDAASHSPYQAEAWSDEAVANLVEFDGSLIGAAWLGRQAARIARPHSRRAVLEVIEGAQHELASDMGGNLAADQLDAFTRALKSLSCLIVETVDET